MFCLTVNEQTELRLIDRQHSAELLALLDLNRGYVRRWHPWVDNLRTSAAVEKVAAIWQVQYANRRGLYPGIWFNGRLCGMVGLHTVDQANRWAPIFYWLDEAHQGQGIATECCRAMIAHAFTTWKLNRITIECATENARSRAIPERLGFQLEGIVRGVEWLQDRFVDHAVYGLLRSDLAKPCSLDTKRYRGMGREDSQRAEDCPRQRINRYTTVAPP
jgi:ribosomal-protein-serine acetyltransferase